MSKYNDFKEFLAAENFLSAKNNSTSFYMSFRVT